LEINGLDFDGTPGKRLGVRYNQDIIDAPDIAPFLFGPFKEANLSKHDWVWATQDFFSYPPINETGFLKSVRANCA